MTQAVIELPKKLIPVFLGEADIRGAHGGRGSGKTRSFAKMAAVRGYMFGNAGITGQILCARQYMNSLEDSSLEECKRAIEEEPFLAEYYEIGEKYIKSRDGRIWFTFAGLDRSIDSIKSKGRILLCWVDEAEPVTDRAFTVLIPTLREEGVGWNAELWITWNRRRKSAAVEQFTKHDNSRIKIVEINWRDNPKFPAVLERARQRDLINRPDEYDHIWEGAYGNIAGSILGKWVAKAKREGRIIPSVRFDPKGSPIELSSDLGFRDTASWWYWQRCVGGFRVLKYDGDSGLDAEEWIPRIQKTIVENGFGKLGKIWLPHDARAKTFQSKHSVMEQFLEAFGTAHVGIVPQSKKSDQISAARKVIDLCEFHQDDCEQGLDGLEAWEYVWNDDLQTFSKEPLHNWASHPSDAFAYGCQVMEESMPPKAEESSEIRGITVGANQVTLEEMWKTMPRSSGRI